MDVTEVPSAFAERAAGSSFPYGVSRMSSKGKSRGLVVLFVASFPVLAVAAAPDTTTEFVFDLWNSRQFDRHGRAARDGNAHMNARLRESADRMEVKERLIANLIDG